jgi:hypothetical protein
LTMLLPPSADMALKEWAVAVRAVSKGDQILILRKGGIDREDKDFRIMHREFLLFPTFEHQQHDLVKPAYHPMLDSTLDEDDVPGLVTLETWCEVTDVFEVRDQETVDGFDAFHLWTAGYARKRLGWRPKYPLTVALLRAYTLQQPQALPVLDEYGGCKSWVDLRQDVPLGHMEAVLGDNDYENRVEAIRQAMDSRNEDLS